MKSATVFLTTITLITFCSCKKNYTCTCTGPIYSATSPATISSDLGKMSKNEAQNKCLEFSFDKSYTDCSIE